MSYRFFISLLLAAIISVSIFWIMQHSISSSTNIDNNGNSYTKMVEFVRLKKNSNNENLKERKRPTPPKNDKPRLIKPLNTKIADSPKEPKFHPEIPDIKFSSIDTSTNLKNDISISSEVNLSAPEIATNLIPIFRVNPRYPRRALKMNIKGWVKLEFMITKDGGVEDIKVVEANPPNVFEKSATRALKQWRFKPAEFNGESVEQRAIQVIRYEKD